MKNIMFVLILIMFCGCASPGRFSLVDLDLRTPEQIEAYRPEAQAPFNGGAESTKEDIVTPKVSGWSFIAPIIQVFKGRIKILSFEWKGNDPKESK